MMPEPHLSTGDLSRILGQPRDRVVYAIRRLGIEPDFRVGLVRAFSPATAEQVQRFLDRRADK